MGGLVLVTGVDDVELGSGKGVSGDDPTKERASLTCLRRTCRTLPFGLPTLSPEARKKEDVGQSTASAALSPCTIAATSSV